MISGDMLKVFSLRPPQGAAYAREKPAVKPRMRPGENEAEATRRFPGRCNNHDGNVRTFIAEMPCLTK